MTRTVFGLFLIAHGLVHLMYLLPRPEDDPTYPFVPEETWLPRVLGLAPSSAKAIAVILAVLSALALAIGGVALIANAAIWQPAAVAGAGLSAVLLLGFFRPWLLLGLAIDVAIMVDVVWLRFPTPLFDR